MASRTRPIRLTLTALLVIPLVSLVALWGYAGFVTLGPAIQEQNYNTEYDHAGQPAVYLSAQLSQERLQTYIWLSSGRRAPSAQMDAERRKTDADVAATRAGYSAAASAMYAPSKAAYAALLPLLNNLEAMRNSIDAGSTSALTAFQEYSHIIDADYNYFYGAIEIPDATSYREAAADLQGAYALELAGREAALVGGAFVTGGRMSRSARELFVQTVAQQRYVIGWALARLTEEPSLRAIFADVYKTPAYAKFAAMENKIVDSPHPAESTPIPFSPPAFQQASQSFIQTFVAAVNTMSVKVSSAGHQLGRTSLLRLILAGGVGLIAVAASVFLLIWFSRRMTRELTGLRDAARNLAENRLPRLVERLRHGEDVDVASESPPPASGKTAEIAAVAQAFGTVQRTAAEAAIGQAQLRKGVSQVFLNLARRNQSLLHRQLNALDVMERRTAEPEALDELFRLDHLTTRMRRYAESLIILSGNVPGRGWSKPVPAVDVVRGAVSEVEDYTRVDVACESQDAIAGAAVADIIHMLAELVENATALSPPNTRVKVRGERVGRGFVVEIEDRGLGLDPENLQALNNQLASRPEFDLAKSDQLGLFVVGELAARHGIRVSLRSNPYGGTTVIVLMPQSVLASEDDFRPPGAAAGDDQASAVPSGHTGAGGVPATSPAMSGPDSGALSEHPHIPGRHRTGPGTGAPVVSPSVSGPGYAATGWDTPVVPADEPPGDRSPTFLSAPGEHAGGWPQSSSTAEAPPAAPERPGQPLSSTESSTYMGLPRRQRQASMVPQLRNRRAAEPAAETGQAGGSPGRSPEEVRDLVSSVHQGWQRGQAAGAQASGLPPAAEGPPWAGDEPWAGQDGPGAYPAADWATGTGNPGFPGLTEGGDQ